MTQSYPAYKFGGKVGMRGRFHAERRCFKRFLRWYNDCNTKRLEDRVYDCEIVGEWIPEVTP